MDINPYLLENLPFIKNNINLHLRNYNVREITVFEMNFVSGAVSAGDAAAVGAQLGGGVGAATGSGVATVEAMTATGLRAGLGAVAGGAVATAGWLGWETGQWLNENTPIQEWISNGIDAITSEGDDYCTDGGDYS